LVTQVVAPEKLLEAAQEKAKKLMRNSPKAQSFAIKAINAAFSRKGFEVEKDLFGQAFTTSDFKEGTIAFVERRKPDFTGK